MERSCVTGRAGTVTGAAAFTAGVVVEDLGQGAPWLQGGTRKATHHHGDAVACPEKGTGFGAPGVAERAGWGLNIEKRRLKGDLPWGWSQVGVRLCSQGTGDRTRGNGFRLDIGKNFSCKWPHPWRD